MRKQMEQGGFAHKTDNDPVSQVVGVRRGSEVGTLSRHGHGVRDVDGPAAQAVHVHLQRGSVLPRRVLLERALVVDGSAVRELDADVRQGRNLAGDEDRRLEAG